MTGVWARVDHARVREHAVDSNDGIIATAVLAGLAFAVGAGIPLLVIVFAPTAWRSAATVLAVVAALSLTALLIASIGGTNIPRTMFRTVSIGLVTMLSTYIGGTLLSRTAVPTPDDA